MVRRDPKARIILAPVRARTIQSLTHRQGRCVRRWGELMKVHCQHQRSPKGNTPIIFKSLSHLASHDSLFCLLRDGLKDRHWANCNQKVLRPHLLLILTCTLSVSVDRFTFMSSRKEDGRVMCVCVCVEGIHQEELTASTFVKLIYELALCFLPGAYMAQPHISRD